jgi:hypothetical protein
MSAVIMRSACEPGGVCAAWGPLPRDVSHVIIDRSSGSGKPRFVTWKEIHAERTKRQMERLRCKRGDYSRLERRAIRVRTWYLDSEIYGGWHCYFDWVGGSEWVRYGSDELMKRFPLADTWEDWKPAFAKRFRRGTQHRRPRGAVYMWALVRPGFSGRVEELLEVIIQ